MNRDDVLKVAGEPVGEMREVEDMNNHTFNRRFTIEPEMFDEPQVGTKLYTEAQLLAVAATTEGRSYAAGAVGMREQAKDMCRKRIHYFKTSQACYQVELDISALPITPTSQKGESHEP